MAKKDDKAKIRLIYVEMEGSNDALESSIRDVVKAISQPQRRTRPALPPTNQQNQLAEDQRSEADGQAEFDFDEVEDADYEEVEERRDKSQSKRNRSKPRYEILELELDSGDPTLKEFYEQKDPSSNPRRFLVMMYWLKEHLGQDAVGVNHIYTCFRFLKITIPSDIGQVFRTMLKQDMGYVSRVDRGSYRINHIGENIVDEMGFEEDGT